VRHRLLWAVALVGLMTAVSGLVSGLFYARTEAMFQTVVQGDLPALTQALKVAEATGRYAVGAATLGAARNQYQRQVVAIALQQQSFTLAQQIAALRQTTIEPALIERVAGPAARLQQVLGELNPLVEQSLQLEGRTREDERALNQAAAGFGAALSAALAAVLRPSEGGPGGAEREALERLGSAGAAVLGRVHEALLADRPAAFGAFGDGLERELGQLEGAAAALAAGEVNQRVRRSVATLGGLGRDLAAMLEQRAHQRAVQEQVETRVQQIVNQRSALAIAVAQLVDAVEAKARAGGESATATLVMVRQILALIALLTLIGSIAFLWFLLGRAVVGPLGRLAAATRAIAAGALATPIPPARHQDEIGAMTEALRVFRDALAALAASEARLRSILDAVVCPLVIVRRADGGLLHANAPALALLGRPGAAGQEETGQEETGQEAVGQEGDAPALRLCDREGRPLAADWPGGDGQVRNQEMVLHDATGTPLWVMVSAAALSYQGEAAVLVSIDDISALKRTEAALRQAKEQAEQTLDQLTRTQALLIQNEKMAALGGLVAGLAHEINTPVGVALTALSHLSEEFNRFSARTGDGRVSRGDLVRLQETGGESIAIGLASIRRAGDLVSSFKRVATDQTHDQRRIFDLGAYLQDVKASLLPTVLARGHTLELSCAGPLVIDTFPGALAEILTNLIMNSLDHGYGGGGEGSPERGGGRLAVAVSAADGAVTLVCRDDGGGIAEAIRAKVFEPFFTTARGSGKTGLGLYTVFNLATHKLKGQITLEGAAAEGACFVVRFPAVLPE